MEKIRREAEDMDLIYYLYVVDGEEHLLGVLSLRDLLVAPPETVLSELMDTRVVSVNIEEKKDRSPTILPSTASWPCRSWMTKTA